MHTGVIIITLLKVSRNTFVEDKIEEQLRINIKRVPAALAGIFFGLP
jgi:hypothetical protein